MAAQASTPTWLRRPLLPCGFRALTSGHLGQESRGLALSARPAASQNVSDLLSLAPAVLEITSPVLAASLP